MTIRDLLKRTQVRSAVIYTVLFTIAVSTLFGTLVLSLTDELEHAIQARVLRTRDALLAIDKRYGFDELASVVTDEAESIRDADNIFALLDADGVSRAGNVREVQPFEGLRVIDRTSLPSVAGGGNRQDRFFSIWTPVSKGMLLVGRSDREARQSKLILLQSLGWGLLATALFALGSGVYLARRSQRRIDDIATTLAAAASGHLDRRVPVKADNDDFDEIGRMINGMLSQLQRLIQNVNQASTDIAHDLKKPLTRLRQRLELAGDDPDIGPALPAVIEPALEEIDSIVATFEALLNIGQLEAGERRAFFVDVDLAAVLRNVIDAYEPVIHDSNYRLDTRLDTPFSATIRGDPELLTQLFANLVENALRHSPTGTLITISLAREAGAVVATVGDTGPGIPSEQRDAVFRRFYRLEQARSTPGHGLGLSLVAAIAELHGAHVDLDDNAPGLRVSLTFPQRRG